MKILLLKLKLNQKYALIHVHSVYFIDTSYAYNNNTVGSGNLK